jgi:serralysin
MAIAISATAVVGSLGINTHIDFAAYGYQNLATVESDINYLGVKIIRDSAETATDAQTWLQVAQATGAKFDDYIAETSPAGMLTDLGFVSQLAKEGILASVEGGNEEDDSYPASLGNTPSITALFQQQVYALGQKLNLPVINMSFGAGWTAANNWQGDYGAVGDLSADTRYANAHTYPNPGQLPDETIQRMNGLAALAASTRPVITSEIGWDTTVFSQQTIAKYVLDAAMDGVKDGDAGMYFYGLYDDASGAWGLFNADGTPRPAATALHNLSTLLTDTNANATSFKPGSLSYTLSGTQTGDNSVLIEKSNGQFWLSLWNETEAANAPHTITVNLGILAATVIEFDPLTGTSSIASWSNVSTLQVSVPDHPVLLEIVPGSGGSVTPSPPPTTIPSGPTFTVPSKEAATAGSTIAVTGVSVIDGFATGNPGTMTLNVSASNGLVAMTSGGVKLAGSGTHGISVNGTLAQINADLATLRYTAASSGGNDVITVDVWDQAGLEGTKSFDVAVTAAASIPPTPPTPSGPVITEPASEHVVVGATAAITGVSIADLFAASNPGSLVLNVSAGTGFVTMTDASGAKVAGSGTHALSVTGTLAQINADLGHLGYTAGGSAGTDSVLIDVWDQAGIEASKSIAITVSSAAPLPAAMPVIKIAATDADPVIAVNGTSINAGSGNHLFFIGGTGDVLTAIGGTETVMAFQGGNTITTGAGNDTIRIAGSGNVVTAGGGTNQIDDSGSDNRIVLPQGGQGFDDIYGYVLQQNDTFDLRPMLAATAWNGNAALIGNFMKVAAPNQADAVITVNPSGIVGGASYSVATLQGSGPVSLSELLSASLV